MSDNKNLKLIDLPKSAEEYGVDYSKPIQKINTEDLQQLLDDHHELAATKEKLNALTVFCAAKEDALNWCIAQKTDLKKELAELKEKTPKEFEEWFLGEFVAEQYRSIFDVSKSEIQFDINELRDAFQAGQAAQATLIAKGERVKLYRDAGSSHQWKYGNSPKNKREGFLMKIELSEWPENAGEHRRTRTQYLSSYHVSLTLEQYDLAAKAVRLLAQMEEKELPDEEGWWIVKNDGYPYMMKLHCENGQYGTTELGQGDMIFQPVEKDVYIKLPFL